MKAKNMLTIAVGALGFVVSAHPALGRLITFEFAGEVTYVQDDNALLPDGVGLGSSFSGSYTFESTTPDSSPDRPTSGLYEGAIVAVAGEVGHVVFAGPTGTHNSISVLNDFIPGGFDHYAADAYVDFLSKTLKFSVTFRDESGTVFLDDSLPLFPPPRESLGPVGFWLNASSEEFSMRGEVISLVPEPGTVVLVGLGVLLARRRARTRTGGEECKGAGNMMKLTMA